jgi:hypothetical protein
MILLGMTDPGGFTSRCYGCATKNTEPARWSKIKDAEGQVHTYCDRCAVLELGEITRDQETPVFTGEYIKYLFYRYGEEPMTDFANLVPPKATDLIPSNDARIPKVTVALVQVPADRVSDFTTFMQQTTGRYDGALIAELDDGTHIGWVSYTTYGNGGIADITDKIWSKFPDVKVCTMLTPSKIAKITA